LATGRTLVALGATDALSAKIIEAHGFECVYIGSYATAANLWRTVHAFEQAGVAACIRAAVEAREDPDFLIIARSDAFWVSGDLEDTIARLQLYAEAGMVFQTLVGPAELAAVRRRVAKPAMIVDMPGRPLAEHKDAAVVLYYAFSALVQLGGLNAAIARFKTDGTLPGGTSELERLLGCDAFAARARKYGES
jgi:methylisocitrate lyase